MTRTSCLPRLPQNMLNTLLAGAIYEPAVNDTIQDRACIRYKFTLPPDEDEAEPLPSKTRRGEYVVFMNEQSAYVLVYVAEEDGYNEHTMENFFQSIRFKSMRKQGRKALFFYAHRACAHGILCYDR